MTFMHGTKSRAYLSGFDCSGFLKEVGQDMEINKAETTNLLSLGKEYIIGLPEGTVSQDGYFDGFGPASDALTFSFLIDSLKGVITESLYLPQGDILGSLGYATQGFMTKDSIKTNTSDAGSVAIEIQSSIGLERGIVAHIKQAETTTANGAMANDNTLASTNGGVGYLHVFAVSGTGGPSLTAKIQHSTDNVSYADLVTFAAATQANKSQRVSVAGTVNRYIRGQWTISGTTPSFTFSLFFARK